MSEQKTGARRASHHRHDARARRYVRRDAIRRNALSSVRPSPARAASPDAKVWLPLDGLAALPALDELLERNVAPDARAHTVLRSAHDSSTAPARRALPHVHPSPARARPHDPDSWFPLAALEELLAPDRLVDSGQTRAVAPEAEAPLRALAVDSPDVVDVVDPVDLELLWELQPVAHPEPVPDLQPAAEPELAPRPLMPEPRSVPESGSVPEAMPSPVPLRAAARPTRRDRIAIRRARARRRLLVVTIATTVAAVGALAVPRLGATAATTETDATTHRANASTTSTRGGSLRWLFTAAAAAPPAPAPAPAAPSTPPPAAAPVAATPVVRAPAPPPKKPVPAPRPTVVMPHTGNTRSGTATWYSHAAGTCAHLGLPMGTSVRITNTANGATASCTVADRGPEAWTGNLIDLSPDVFRQLAPLGAGRINVRLDY